MKRTDFINKRIRLQRVADARLGTGWVTALDKNVISVKINGSQFLRSGDSCYCEIEGEGDTLIFQAQLLSFGSKGLIFQITEAVKTKVSNIEARTCVDDVLIEVSTSTAKFREKICDLSRHGLAFEGGRPISIGSEVDFTLIYEGMDISAKGVVRNCRRIPMSLDRYRIGLEIGDLSRLETAKWIRAMNSAA